MTMPSLEEPFRGSQCGPRVVVLRPPFGCASGEFVDLFEVILEAQLQQGDALIELDQTCFRPRLSRNPDPERRECAHDGDTREQRDKSTTPCAGPFPPGFAVVRASGRGRLRLSFVCWNTIPLLVTSSCP